MSQLRWKKNRHRNVKENQQGNMADKIWVRINNIKIKLAPRQSWKEGFWCL
jgi:hypothetical protein